MIDIEDFSKYMNKQMKKAKIIPEELELKYIPNEEQKISVKDLRQEAIKWIKALENIEENENGFEEFKDGEFTLSNVPYECCETSAVIGFIQHFFNITDEELK